MLKKITNYHVIIKSIFIHAILILLLLYPLPIICSIKSYLTHDWKTVKTFSKLSKEQENPKWRLPLERLKLIKCGALPTLLENTISISFCQNRIYQFNFDLTVTMYDNARNLYSHYPDRLHLVNGRNIPIKDIHQSVLNLGKFQIRFENLLKAYPQEKHKRISIILIRSIYGFIWYSRLMLAGDRFWVVGKANEQTGQETYKYQVTQQRLGLIPISGGHQYYHLTYDSQNHFNLYDQENLTEVYGNLCISGKLSSRKLRLIDPEQKCAYKDDYKAQSLGDLLKPINYGFTTFINLILVSNQSVIVINRNILNQFDKNFRYEIRSLNEYFTCEKNVNWKKPDDFIEPEQSDDDDDDRQEKSETFNVD